MLSLPPASMLATTRAAQMRNGPSRRPTAIFSLSAFCLQPSSTVSSLRIRSHSPLRCSCTMWTSSALWTVLLTGTPLVPAKTGSRDRTMSQASPPSRTFWKSSMVIAPTEQSPALMPGMTSDLLSLTSSKCSGTPDAMSGCLSELRTHSLALAAITSSMVLKTVRCSFCTTRKDASSAVYEVTLTKTSRVSARFERRPAGVRGAKEELPPKKLKRLS
mmetsp:Transcript_97262/g.302860  ORF Transcript_97262/g.302860 Transcript_97262/m.302860 type:complete len:217 (-) Transcript_97262:1037-1687(-)